MKGAFQIRGESSWFAVTKLVRIWSLGVLTMVVWRRSVELTLVHHTASKVNLDRGGVFQMHGFFLYLPSFEYMSPHSPTLANSVIYRPGRILSMFAAQKSKYFTLSTSRIIVWPFLSYLFSHGFRFLMTNMLCTGWPGRGSAGSSVGPPTSPTPRYHSDSVPLPFPSSLFPRALPSFLNLCPFHSYQLISYQHISLS